jgi:peroxiredoxin
VKSSSHAQPKSAFREKLSKLRQNKAAQIAFQILIVVVAVLAIRAYQTRNTARGEAPALAARTIEDEAVDLAALRGEPVIVHFFATWCGVCKAEEHNIKAVAEDHPMIAIATQSGGVPAVAQYADENGLAMPLLIDPQGQLADEWGVGSFPTTFVIDPDGRIASVEVGYTTELGLRGRLAWAGLWN